MTTGLFPDLEPRLLRHEAMDLLARGGADNLFIEQHRRRLQFRQHQRGIERRIEPSMGVAQVGIIGDAPAQIKNAAGLDDVEQAADRRPRSARSSRCMITVSHSTLSKRARQCRSDRAIRHARISSPDIAGALPSSKPSEASKPAAGKTVGIEPADLAATAAADIGRIAASDEKPLDDFLQVDGRRLFVPVLGERCRIRNRRRPASCDPRINPRSWKNPRPRASPREFRSTALVGSRAL